MNKIIPDKVTKPYQLLAAWLTGLIIVNGSFLASASSFGSETWLSGSLVIASIINVPLFLLSIFLLQTRFRPEMQEDQFYSQYLEKKVSNETGEKINGNRDSFAELHKDFTKCINELNERITKIQIDIDSKDKQEIIGEVNDAAISVSKSIDKSKEETKVQLNNLLPNYKLIAKKFEDNKIKISRYFGSTSEKAKEPRLLLVTYGAGANPEVFQEIIQILRSFENVYVSYTDEVYNLGHIYVGSYAYELDKTRSFHYLTDELWEKLSEPNISSSEIAELLNI